MLALVFFHLHVPAHKLGSEAGILAATADCLAQIFFIHRDVNDTSSLVKSDAANLSGFKRLSHKFVDVIRPTDDVDFFIIQFAHDVLNACSTKTDACADRIDFVVVTINRHFRAISGFTRNGTKLHGAIRNLSHFRFEKATHKVGMAPGKDDLRSTTFVIHRNDIAADTIPYVVILSRNTLRGRHAGFKFPEINHDVTFLKAAHRTTDDVTRAVLELIINLLFLGLTKTLHHGLLRSLHRNPTEVGRSHIKIDVLTQLNSKLLLGSQ